MSTSRLDTENTKNNCATTPNMLVGNASAAQSAHREKARAALAITDKEHSCCCAQALCLAFSADTGLSDEQAYKIAANFEKGMRTGNVCGAICASLMVLGLMGINDAKTIRRFYRALQEKHGTLLCAQLLKNCRAQGQNTDEHCDNMVYECISLIEEILSATPGLN